MLETTAAGICGGQYSIFESPPVPLNFTLPLPLAPWPQHESQTWLAPHTIGEKAGSAIVPPENRERQGEGSSAQVGGEGIDIKFIWEPARFGWAVHLARAAHMFGDPDGKYRTAFWSHLERFRKANPPAFGPNWASAQEVAIRLISLCLAWEVFGPASSPQQASALAAVLASHAARIPPSLDYARAQNNNHRLSEAAGLYTAGLYLPGHPQALRWRQLGWKEFHDGLVSQVSPTGEYCQHSVNYHRLMLQLALWVKAISSRAGEPFPEESLSRLEAASHWLAGLLDQTSGAVPNLGPNDGAYILPLTSAPYRDYRPILQAALQTFSTRPYSLTLDQDQNVVFFDEMSAWLSPQSGLKAEVESNSNSLPVDSDQAGEDQPSEKPDAEQRGWVSLRTPRSWALLRTAHFTSRPGHADQLHFDLWWHGLNLALDPGTYLYNAPPPWDNRLVGAEVHNTLTVRGQDQMQRVGRFLYLAPAQAEITEALRTPDGSIQKITARHNGYARLGALHVRNVSVYTEDAGDRWLVEDQVVNLPKSIFAPSSTRQAQLARLHWLLPDLPWELDASSESWSLVLQTTYGPVHLKIQSSLPGKVSLGRAGKKLAGDGEILLNQGWFSPNYGRLLPALSLAVEVVGFLPLSFTTQWILPA